MKKKKLTKRQKYFIKIRVMKDCPKDKVYIVATREELTELGFETKLNLNGCAVIKGLKV